MEGKRPFLVEKLVKQLFKAFKTAEFVFAKSIQR